MRSHASPTPPYLPPLLGSVVTPSRVIAFPLYLPSSLRIITTPCSPGALCLAPPVSLRSLPIRSNPLRTFLQFARMEAPFSVPRPEGSGLPRVVCVPRSRQFSVWIWSVIAIDSQFTFRLVFLFAPLFAGCCLSTLSTLFRAIFLLPA